ncbi:polynucleotide adenylyltransferase region [Novosphingobium nitrogenifigens DSM 19370]|uniref:Polynucleotide adenylyltransferase region n=1 Tax=Novosphingobium nitrogenifigens DSM 19370 TaxID=983920 RepID=F1ZBW9_9SPHN|nr:CCA tRNA nucleotidyltransferase [Novosphingobium nitrogenifigens]EGD57955.1 polynucleotide adenylyltransferase region [Novosphingobium nitrogenifigens DSM 19370]
MTSSLPAAPWTRREDLAEVVLALDPDGEGLCRWVGGAVRDTLVGIAVKDIDMATRLLPEETLARLKAAGIKAIPTGLAHGTVTALTAGGPVEITTLRRDVETDGRHATVAFSTDWREDAARRDFTINALYADPRTLEISDYFGGQADLAAHRVRFIGDAETRIREDYLRILRYFRFHARFGSLPADAEAEEACARLAPGLKGLSRERVGWELLRLLGHPDPAPTLRRMAELGVLAQILPEADPEALPPLVAAEACENVAPDSLRRLAAILPPDPPLAEQVAARLRLSTAQKKRLATAAARTSETGEPRALAYRLGMTEASDRLLLAGQSLAPLAGWSPPTFPLKGGAIVARGIGAGPMVARLLRTVENRWIDEGFPDEERIEAMLQEEIARLPST